MHHTKNLQKKKEGWKKQAYQNLKLRCHQQIKRRFYSTVEAFLFSPSLSHYIKPHTPSKKTRKKGRLEEEEGFWKNKTTKSCTTQMVLTPRWRTFLPTPSLSHYIRSHAPNEKPLGKKGRLGEAGPPKMQSYEIISTLPGFLFHGGGRFFPLLPCHYTISPTLHTKNLRKTGSAGRSRLT